MAGVFLYYLRSTVSSKYMPVDSDYNIRLFFIAGVVTGSRCHTASS
jgi:hypothetical protein